MAAILEIHRMARAFHDFHICYREIAEVSQSERFEYFNKLIA